MSRNLRATTGTSDIRNEYSNTSTPGMNPNRITPVNTVLNLTREFMERLLFNDAFEKLGKLAVLKDSLEQSIPEGVQAELVASGAQFKGGFDFQGILPPGSEAIDDGTQQQRSLRGQLTGKAKSAPDPNIQVEIVGVSNPTRIDLIPSWNKTELTGRDGQTRITTRTVDNMSYHERHYYEHPDRELA